MPNVSERSERSNSEWSSFSITEVFSVPDSIPSLQLQSRGDDIPVIFVPSRHGKHLSLVHNNYTFKRQRENCSGKVVWYCSRRGVGCKAYAHTFQGELIAVTTHDHEPPC